MTTTGTRLELLGVLVDRLAGEVTITYNVRHHHEDNIHLLATAAQAKLTRLQLGEPLWTRVETLVKDITSEMSISVGLAPKKDGGETPLDDWDPKAPEQEQEL